MYSNHMSHGNMELSNFFRNLYTLWDPGDWEHLWEVRIHKLFTFHVIGIEFNNTIYNLLLPITDRKQHRNGIKRPKTYRFPSLKGVSNISQLFLFLVCCLFISLHTSMSHYCGMCSA